MPAITFLTDKQLVESLPGETLLETSLRSGMAHAHLCGGIARCSTCRVMIIAGLEHCAPRNQREQLMAERLHLNARIRLACQTTVSGNVSLRRLVLDSEDIALTSQLNGDKLPLSVGEEKKIAILFADIRGFTTFAEALPPYDVIHVLNRYFASMDREVRQHSGFINNYMGDGLLALFGVDQAEQATLHAVQAGLAMLQAVTQLQTYLHGVYGMGFHIGIGIHYGEVVLGSVGGQGQRRMTAIGDAVNFASRIEAANKEYGTQLLVSQEALTEVQALAVTGRQCNQVSLRGKSGLYTLYELTGLKPPIYPATPG